MTSNENVEQWCNDLGIKLPSLHGYLSAINQYSNKLGALGVPSNKWKNISEAFEFIQNAEWEPHNSRGLLPVLGSYHVPSYEQATKEIRNTGTANLTVGDPICLLPMFHQAQAKYHRSDDYKIKMAPSSLSVPTDIDDAYPNIMFPATVEKGLYQNRIIPDVITGILCKLIHRVNSSEVFYAKVKEELEINNFFDSPAALGNTPMSKELEDHITRIVTQMVTHFGALGLFLHAEHQRNSAIDQCIPQFITDVQQNMHLHTIKSYSKMLNKSTPDRKANTSNFRKSFRIFLNSLLELHEISNPPVYAKVSGVAGAATFPHQQFMQIETANTTGQIPTVTPDMGDMGECAFYKRYGQDRCLQPVDTHKNPMAYMTALNELNSTSMRATNKGGSEHVRTIESFNNGPDIFDTRMNSWLCLAPRTCQNKGPALFRIPKSMLLDHVNAIEAYAVRTVSASFEDFFMPMEGDEKNAKLYPGQFGTDLESWIDLFELYNMCCKLNAKIGKYLRTYVTETKIKDVDIYQVEPMHRLEIPQYGYNSEEDERKYNIESVNCNYQDDKLIVEFKGWLNISEQNKDTEWGPATKEQNKKKLSLACKVHVLRDDINNIVMYGREIIQKIIPQKVAKCTTAGAPHGHLKDGAAIIEPGHFFRARLI